MLAVTTASALAEHVGKKLGPSSWMEISQKIIDSFADATGDHQWIHVDPKRSMEELGRPTIAHGLLLLSLIPVLSKEIVLIENRRQALNYGSDRIRYLLPVEASRKVRLYQTLVEVREKENGIRVVWGNELEVSGEERPALIARTIALMQE